MARFHKILNKLIGSTLVLHLISTASACLGLFGCSQNDNSPPSSTDRRDSYNDPKLREDFNTDGITHRDTDKKTRKNSPAPPLSLTESFATTIHPLLTERCGSCHSEKVAPFFANEDAEAASSALLDTDKVNFEDPKNSRIYLRLLKDKHNCWSECESDAKAVLGLIKKWQKQVSIESNISPMDSWTLTKGLKFNQAKSEAHPHDPQTIVLDARIAKLTGSLVLVVDPETKREVLGGKPLENGRDGFSRGSGTAIFEVSVPQKGTYTFWVSVKNTQNQADLLSITIAGRTQVIRIDPTNDRWLWLASTKDYPAITVELESGNQTISLNSPNSFASISRIALTTRNQLDEIYADNNPRKFLRYDVSKIMNKSKTYLEIDISDYSESAFVVRRPKIVTDAQLSIKGLRILVNGKYSSQHNTYNLIDVKVTPPETLLSEAAMVVLKDKGLDTDKLSFAFEEIK